MTEVSEALRVLAEDAAATPAFEGTLSAALGRAQNVFVD